MDLLSGYGSDDSGAGAPMAPVPVALPESSITGSNKRALDLPQPATSLPEHRPRNMTDALSHLPLPKAAKLAKQQPRVFRVPIDVSSLVDSDEEEQVPAKRAKVTNGSARLKDFLPAPKHSMPAAAAPDPPQSQQGFSASSTAQPNGHSSYSNEHFRVSDAAADSNHAEPHPQSYPTAADAEHGAVLPAAAVRPQYGNEQAERWQGTSSDATAYAAESGTSEGQHLLAQAMPGRQAGGASHGSSAHADPFAGLGVQFKEVHQSNLTKMDAMARESANAARTAFGADYEARLRSEAGAKPDKTSRRKHQISSLYHAAKLKELEALETRTQGIKTKMETQAKYGW